MDDVNKESEPFFLNKEDLRELEPSLSAVRLTKYLAQTDENYQDAFRLYIWNTAASAVFYGSLQAFEITLRNRINDQLAEKYGAEWVDIDKTSIDFFHSDHSDRIRDAKKDLIGKKSPITPPDIIANLSFGFWVFLLAGHYEERLWRAWEPRAGTVWAEKQKTLYYLKHSRKYGDMVF